MDQEEKDVLELAAKAIQLELIWIDKIDNGFLDEYIETHPNPHWRINDEKLHATEWNPLKNNAQAFELMVKLNLTVETDLEEATVISYNSYSEKTLFVTKFSDVDNDIQAAVRCSLTYAAADIQKCKEEEEKKKEEEKQKKKKRKNTGFAKWYEEKTGITLDEAERRETWDLKIMEEAWDAAIIFERKHLSEKIKNHPDTWLTSVTAAEIIQKG